MTHHRNRLRLVTVPLGVAGLVVAGALTAWAHVEVEAEPATVGGTDVTLTFHVPNEQAPAVTTEVTFVMPVDHPLVGVTARPQNGFKPRMTMRHSGVAVPGTHGPVFDVVSQVTFSGGTIKGEDEQPFVLHVDKMPAGVRTLTFKALQHYSNGSTVSWIEVAADGAAEPEHPAPVLTLVGPVPSAMSSAPSVPSVPSASSGSPGTVAAVRPAAPGASPPAGPSLPVAGLGLAALGIGSVVVVLLVRRRIGQG